MVKGVEEELRLLGQPALVSKTRAATGAAPMEWPHSSVVVAEEQRGLTECPLQAEVEELDFGLVEGEAQTAPYCQ
jgi:hypothetical protein